jgi:predicted phosphoadenosine phosphosulfate sulfurtransferase
MSAEPPATRPAPVREDVLLELTRRSSVLRVLFSEWQDGHRSVTIAFTGLNAEEPRSRYIAIQKHEVGRVAVALMRICDEQKWWADE